MSTPSTDGMGPNLRAFHDRPWPRCSCMACRGKQGMPGLRCAVVMAKLEAKRRDDELLNPKPIVADDEGFTPDFDTIETISANSLSPQEKRTVWEFIKQHRPDVLDFLQDEQVQAIMKTTGATPAFETEMVVSALGYHPGYSNAA